MYPLPQSPAAILSRTLGRLAAPALAVLALAGCGGGGAYGPYEPVGGTLEVRNAPYSFEGIDSVEVSQPFGPIAHYDMFLAPGEWDYVDLIPDGYDVDLFWSDGSVDSFFGIDIYPGSTTVVTGDN